MLRFFRVNDPYRLLILFLVLITVRVVQSYFIMGFSIMEVKWLALGEWLGQGFSMYRETFDYTGPLAAFVYKYIDMLFGRSAFVHCVFSSLLIIVQASIFNGLLLKNKAYEENGYLPAFCYVIVILSIPDFMALSPQLMALTFVLLTLRNILRRINNLATDELFLVSGIYIGLAAMIYLPAMVFLPIFLVALVLFSTAIIRRLLLYLFGFLIVFGLFSVYFYWKGDLVYFLDYYLFYGLVLNAEVLLPIHEMVMVAFAIIVVFALSAFKTLFARLTFFQQKIQRVLWLMFFGAVACFFLANKKTGLELLLITPVIAYFLAFYFLLLKRRFFRFIMPGIVVFGLLGFSLFSYQNLTSSLVLGQDEKVDQKIMVLGNNLDFYAGVEAYSPTFDVGISRKAWNGLDYYEQCSSIFKMLEKASPDLIIDRMNITPKLFARFPTIKEKYEEQSEGVYKRISN